MGIAVSLSFFSLATAQSIESKNKINDLGVVKDVVSKLEKRSIDGNASQFVSPFSARKKEALKDVSDGSIFANLNVKSFKKMMVIWRLVVTHQMEQIQKFI